MEKFEQLDWEKQRKIINASLKSFGKYGYQKTSMNQVAIESGISKAMIFYYFKNKLGLYQFLVDFSFEHITKSFEENQITTTDFFDFLIDSAKVKINSFKEYPQMMKFITSFYFETSPDVATIKEEFINKGDVLRKQMVGPELDYYKFKSSVDPEALMSMLVTWSEGYIAKYEKQIETYDTEQFQGFIDQMIKEYIKYLEMFRQNFYQEEYL